MSRTRERSERREALPGGQRRRKERSFRELPAREGGARRATTRSVAEALP